MINVDISKLRGVRKKGFFVPFDSSNDFIDAIFSPIATPIYSFLLAGANAIVAAFYTLISAWFFSTLVLSIALFPLLLPLYGPEAYGGALLQQGFSCLNSGLYAVSALVSSAIYGFMTAVLPPIELIALMTRVVATIISPQTNTMDIRTPSSAHSP